MILYCRHFIFSASSPVYLRKTGLFLTAQRKNSSGIGLLRFFRLWPLIFSVFWLATTPLWGQTLPMSEGQLAQKTIGRVQPESVRKAGGSFEEYLARRGLDSAAGKGFEALAAIRYNRLGTQNILLPTAALGRPDSPCDLILLDRQTGWHIAYFQAKLGKSAAIAALADPKYAQTVIVLPPDELEKIVETIRRRLARGRGLSPELEQAQAAVCSGQMTSVIDGMTLPKREEAKTFTRDYLQKAFEQTATFGR